MLIDDDLGPVQAIHCIYSISVSDAPPPLYILVEARSFLSAMHKLRFPCTGKERRHFQITYVGHSLKIIRMCISWKRISCVLLVHYMKCLEYAFRYLRDINFFMFQIEQGARYLNDR